MTAFRQARPYDPQTHTKGAGAPVVLVPGMDGTGLLFYRQIPLLARSYTAVTYALRDTAASMDVLVADLLRIIDSVAPPGVRATIVGESFGGALALSAALALPDRVQRLVILNSFPYFEPQVRLHLALAGLHAMPWGAMSLVRRLTAFRLHSPHTRRREIRRFMALTERASQHGYVNRLKALTRYDVRARLAEIRVPTLLLASDADHLVPAVAQAHYMADRIPRATLRILRGHGHICLIAPDIDLAQILHDWEAGLGQDAPLSSGRVS